MHDDSYRYLHYLTSPFPLCFFLLIYLAVVPAVAYGIFVVSCEIVPLAVQGFSVVVHRLFISLWQVGSQFPDQDHTRIPCTAKGKTPNHWTTRKVLPLFPRKCGRCPVPVFSLLHLVKIWLLSSSFPWNSSWPDPTVAVTSPGDICMPPVCKLWSLLHLTVWSMYYLGSFPSFVFEGP